MINLDDFEEFGCEFQSTMEKCQKLEGTPLTNLVLLQVRSWFNFLFNRFEYCNFVETEVTSNVLDRSITVEFFHGAERKKKDYEIKEINKLYNCLVFNDQNHYLGIK